MESSKRLVYADGTLIGDYPDGWIPPEESDIAAGLKEGSMKYIESPPEARKEAPVDPLAELRAKVEVMHAVMVKAGML